MSFTSQRSLLRRVGIAVAALLVLVMATEAFAARKARATGFYRVGRGQVNLPLQFVVGMAPAYIALGFPNDDAMIDDDISLIGKSPAAILLPENVVDGSYTALLPLMGTNAVQITTMFTLFQAPEASGGALFSTAGGPGSFTFCPGTAPGMAAAICPGVTDGMGNPNPPQGSGTRNGRVVYTGGGGFGGVSQALLGGGGLVTTAAMGFGFGSPIFQAGQELFGGGMGGMTPQAPGGPYGFTDVNMLNGAVYTQPKTAPTTVGTISAAQAGPYVTSMGGLTSCPSTTMGGAYPNIPLTGSLACVLGSTMAPLKTAGSGTTSNTGFPFTTGTVLVQQTTNVPGNSFFTIAGSDARTPKGIGNITLVAGGLAERTNNANPGGSAGGSVDVISITISEKTPSMSAAGFAAAALLMVLGAGYALRRRF